MRAACCEATVLRHEVIADDIRLLTALWPDRELSLIHISPAMAAAVCQSSAARVLIPINHCDNIVVGVPDQPIGQLVAAAVEKVSQLCSSGCR